MFARHRLTFCAIIASAFIIGLIIVTDRQAVPAWMKAIYDFPGGDKFAHMILFGGLAFILDLAAGGRTFRFGIPLPIVGVVLAILVAIEEFSQAFFPSRTASLLDLGASYLGIFLGIRLAGALRRRGIGVPSRS